MAYEPFVRSCQDSAEYPQNLISPEMHVYDVKSYYKRFKEHEGRLFCEQQKAAVGIWDLGDGGKGSQYHCAKSEPQLQRILRSVYTRSMPDPMCRFIFINAPHSRERLNITKEMFNFALTYHQVMVAFLDFVFPFGSQIEPHDNSSAFRSINHLSDLDKGFSLTELGRSGLSLQQAYNLKAVEPKDDSDWPWSIRQTAIYHSFDQANGRTIWIIIKGNSSMEKRMKAAQERLTPNGISKHQKTEDAFLLSLELHMVVCEWARENWRWFINFLDEKLHIATRGTATADVGSPKLVSTVRSPPTDRHIELSFDNIKQIQFLEEKSNEVSLVLQANIGVLEAMKHYYQFTTSSPEFPSDLNNNCGHGKTGFFRRLTTVVDDMQMQKSRVDVLLRQLSNRKNLVNGIFEFRSMEANKAFSEKAQQSAQMNQILSAQMYLIAKRTMHVAEETGHETVSMRIITLVTLFFLPGTFVSTLMSTPIVQFNPPPSDGQPRKVFSSAALKLYLVITLPLMVLTFISWAFYKYAERRKDKKKNEKPGHDIELENLCSTFGGGELTRLDIV